ncbi:MAG: hypothetical protein KDJ69_10300 [Nitratireductor sp.]|nr:hypothetical protein [Nitratireductor sp.]
MPYRTLDPDKIITTSERLAARIGERFQGSGLSNVAGELASLALDTKEKAALLEQPIWWLRALIAIVTVCGAMVFIFIGTFLSFDRIGPDGFDFVQGIEAGINTLVLAGLGYVTLFKAEERIKRRKVLDGLHSLRSLIHVIDMHQLTKDPVVFNQDFTPTASSPTRKLTRNGLSRYLDYCSEMLAVTGKLAALYAQAVPDTEVAEAVNDVEMLGSNLSRKIWQKIMLIGPEAKPVRKPRA